MPPTYLKNLKAITDKVCKIAYLSRHTFKDAAVNWADFYCHSAEYYVDDGGNEGYRIWIEEASPDNPELKDFIRDELAIAGYPNIEVMMEWRDGNKD